MNQVMKPRRITRNGGKKMIQQPNGVSAGNQSNLRGLSMENGGIEVKYGRTAESYPPQLQVDVQEQSNRCERSKQPETSEKIEPINAFKSSVIEYRR